MRINYKPFLIGLLIVLAASGLKAASDKTPLAGDIVVKDDVPYLEIEDALNGTLLIGDIAGKEGVPAQRSDATGDITPRLSDFVKKKDVPRNGGEVVSGNTHLSFELRVSPDTQLVNVPAMLTCVLSNRTDKPLQVYEGRDFYGITYFVTFEGKTHRVRSTIQMPIGTTENPYCGRLPLPPPLETCKEVRTEQNLTADFSRDFPPSLFAFPGEYTVHAIHESKATGTTRSNDVKVKRRGPETDAERKALELVANPYVFGFLQRSKGVGMYANSTNTIAAVQALADLGDATPFHAAAVRTLKLLADWQEERRQHDEWYKKRVAERKAVEELAAKGLGPKWGEEPEFVYPQKPKRQYGCGAPVQGKIAEELTAQALRLTSALLVRGDMKEFESYVAKDMEDVTHEKDVIPRCVFIYRAQMAIEGLQTSQKQGVKTSETIKGVFLSDKEGEFIVKYVVTNVDWITKKPVDTGTVFWFSKYSNSWQLKRVCYLGRVDENFEEVPEIISDFVLDPKAISPNLGPKGTSNALRVYPSKPRRQYGCGAPVEGQIAEELTDLLHRLTAAQERGDMEAFESYVAKDMEDVTDKKYVKPRSVFLYDSRPARGRLQRLQTDHREGVKVVETIKGVFLSDKENEYIVKHVSTRSVDGIARSYGIGTVYWFSKDSGSWLLKRICHLGPVNEHFQEIWGDPEYDAAQKAASATPVLNSKTNAPHSK
jgi:hypothetical protein